MELQPFDYAALARYPYPFRVEDPLLYRAKRIRVSDIYREYKSKKRRGLPKKVLASIIINKNYWDIVRESWWLIQYLFELSRA